MKNDKSILEFHQEVVNSLIDLEKESNFPEYFYQVFLSGDNTLYQKETKETKTFDEEWIKTIESFFPSLDRIIRDPKSGLRYEQEVLAIEKARKTNRESVRHLAANTHLIKEIKDDFVIPKKILVTQSDIDYGIYENRFIKTLIERLYEFVNRRVSIIKNNIDSFITKDFKLDSNFKFEEVKVDFNLNVKLVSDTTDIAVKQYNIALLNRATDLQKKVTSLMQTEFMVNLKNARSIVPPIMQTSIMLKNIYYKNCYLLWLFLDKYNNLAFEVAFQEKNLRFDEIYLKNIYQSALVSFLNIYANQEDLKKQYQYLDTKEYKKKSPKQIKRDLNTIVDDIKPFEVEDVRLNEFFLEQNKKIFQKSLEVHQNSSSSYDVALRKALRDTISISNALFQSYFELEAKDDVFTRLIKEDTEELLEKAREKLKVAKIIRETKEVDYNNAIRLERKILKEIERLDRIHLKEVEKSIKDLASLTKVQEKIQLEKENASRIDESLKEYLSYVNLVKEHINQEHIDTTQKINDTKKGLLLKEKEEIKAAKQKAKEDYFNALNKIREKQEKQRLILRNKLKEKQKQEKQRLAIKTAKLKNESKAKINKQKEKIASESKAKINKLKQGS